MTLSELLIPLRGFSDDLWGSGYQTLSVGSKVSLLISLHNLKRGCQACFATHQTWLKFQHVCENLRLISPKEQAKECARTASNGERNYAFLSTSFTCHILAKSPNRPKASTCCASTTPTWWAANVCLCIALMDTIAMFTSTSPPPLITCVETLCSFVLEAHKFWRTQAGILWPLVPDSWRSPLQIECALYYAAYIAQYTVIY